LKTLKIIAIISLAIFIIIAAIYITAPLIIKSYLPDYLPSNTLISSLNISKAYYPSFSMLNIDDISFTIDKKDSNIYINIPKTIITLNKLAITLIHPVILGEINIDEFIFKRKKSDTKPTIRGKIKLYFAKKIIKNLDIKKSDILVKYIKFKKDKLENIKAQLVYKDSKLYIKDINLDAFGGKIKANAVITPDIEYDSELSFFDINLSNIVDLINPKYKITGQYTGKILIQGKGSDIKKLSGGLTSDKKGGRIDISDLDRLAQKGNEASIVIQQLKNFSYKEGIININSSGNSLFIKAIFTGDQGTKDLEFVFHDILGGEKWLIK